MKLRRKLLAAGFAFGATALTLTTSTFAWYTANNEVSIESITGATAAATDTSLFVAAAQTYEGTAPGAKVATYNTWSTKQTPVLVNSSAARTLTPVAYKGDNTYSTFSTVTANYSTAATQPDSDTFALGKYYLQNGAGTEASPYVYTLATSYDSTKTYFERLADTITYASDSTATTVYEYVLRFQKPNSSTETPVYVSAFNLTNTATSANSAQQALANNQTLGGTANVGVLQPGAYNVDMLHALKMTVAVTNLSSTGEYITDDSTTTEIDEAAVANLAPQIYDLDGFADPTKDINIGPTAAAVSYYNTVLGRNIANENSSYLTGVKAFKTATAAAANSTNSVLFTIPESGFVEVRFTFWLDGWDSFCYDVCQKQNFTVDMSFSTEAGKSVLTANANVATGKPANSGE